MLDLKLKLHQVEKDMHMLRSKQANLNNSKPVPPSGHTMPLFLILCFSKYVSMEDFSGIISIIWFVASIFYRL